MATVDTVRRQALPSGTRIVAGEAGLYNEVSWVVSLKPTPPGFDILRGGELALASTRMAALLGASLSSLVTSLGERGAAAVALLGQASAEARDRAQGLSLPLLELPPQTSLPPLEQRIADHINQERLSLYQREQEFSRALTDLAITGRGLHSIVGRLSKLTEKALGVLDEGFGLTFYLPGPDGKPDPTDAMALLQPHLEGAVRRLRDAPQSAAEPSVVGLPLSTKMAAFFSPIIAAGGSSSYLFLLAHRKDTADIDRIAVRRGAAALAIYASRLQAATETEDRLQAGLVEALTTGDFTSSRAVQERARRLGYELAPAYMVLAASTQGPSPAAEALRREVAALREGALCHLRGQEMLILLPLTSADNPQVGRKAAEQAATELSRRLGAPLAVGLGRHYAGPQGVSRGYQEAQQALNMGRRLFGHESFTYFGDLGVYRLLFALLQGGELESFYQEHLGRLADYDRRRGGELLQTLDALLRHPTLAATATALKVHRNTLLYRLRRISTLAGLDLEDPETRLTLSLAFRSGEVLHSS
ncbi:MAG: helix-turn-helix domain-containing protein [Dehalococcoidia bacterium]|nr:helix-turn-helix domain-containing protein [Dehalococcoidia bacterium]